MDPLRVIGYQMTEAAAMLPESIEFPGGFVYYKVYIKRTMAVDLHGRRNAAGSTEGD